MDGTTTLSYADDTRTGNPSSFLAPYVVVAMECRRPLAVPERFSMAEVDRVSLGRGRDRDHARQRSGGHATLRVEIPDGWMSSDHAEFERGATFWTLVDKGSKNGTFVNGKRIERVTLRDGDLVEVGSSILLFRDKVRREIGDEIDVTAGDLAERSAGMATLAVELGRDFAALERVAVSDLPMLVLGETGTGKEVTAQAIHELSNRRGKFVGVNCGAIPDQLVESELFGHKKGAFSGAVEDAPGLVRQADGGTLFLDEIAELPAQSQVALLRVLQENEVRPVGGTGPVSVDVRVVAATHQPLEKKIAEGAFREDLFSRLNGMTVRLPPLRERREDVGLIIGTLLSRAAGDKAADVTFTRSAARALFHYSWPRNIRELDMALRSALALAGKDAIEPKHLPTHIAGAESAEAPAPRDAKPLSPEDQELKLALHDALTEQSGNVSAVARAMGKAPVQIRRWLKRFGLDADTYRG